jgi:cobalamin biosynthesis protein CobD/CbiB
MAVGTVAVDVTTPFSVHMIVCELKHNKEQLLLSARHRAKPLVFITDWTLLNKRYHRHHIRQRHVRPTGIVFVTFSILLPASLCHLTAIIVSAVTSPLLLLIQSVTLSLRLIIIRSRHSSAGTRLEAGGWRLEVPGSGWYQSSLQLA